MMKQQNNWKHNFVVSIMRTENHSWQGTLSWVEGDKKENFRSALELLRLMDSAVSSEEEKDGGDSREA